MRYSKLPVAVAALLLAAVARAGTFAGVDVPPPLPKKDLTDAYWGVTVNDPYRHLETVSDPAVQAWLRGQCDATTAILDKIPARAAMLARIHETEAAAPGAVGQVDRVASGRIFFTRRNPDEDQFKLVWRDGPDGADTVLVDPEALSKAQGKAIAVQDFSASPDGKRIAYSLQVGGAEIGYLHVVEVETGRELTTPIDRIRFAGPRWLEDGSGLFYGRLRENWDRLPAGERFGDRQTRFLTLDASSKSDDDRLVASPTHNPELGLPIYAGGGITQIPGTQTALMFVFLGVERYRLVFVAPLEQAIRGTAKWKRVADVGDEISDVSATRDWIYLITTKDAPRGKIVRLPLKEPQLANAETVVPGSDDVVVGMAAARDGLYVRRRQGAAIDLVRVAHDAPDKLQPIETVSAGNVAILDADSRLDGAVLSIGGWTQVAKPYLLTAGSRRPLRLALVRDGAFDAPPDIEAREIKVKSHDGVEIPVSVLVRKDLKLDGSNPTIVYGYGAYGITEDPFFNPRVYAWLERGGVYAF